MKLFSKHKNLIYLLGIFALSFFSDELKAQVLAAGVTPSAQCFSPAVIWLRHRLPVHKQELRLIRGQYLLPHALLLIQMLQ